MKTPRKSTDRGSAWKVVATAILITGALAGPAVAAAPTPPAPVELAGNDWT